MHPQPRVQSDRKHTSVVTTVTPETPGIPRAMVLTAYTALSPVTGLFCHRRLRIASADLTPASGCQDHTTSPSASALSSAAPSASTASRPTSVTIAKRPSEEAGPNRYIPVSTRPSSKILKIRNCSGCRWCVPECATRPLAVG